MRCLPRPRADHYTGCNKVVNAGLEYLDRHNIDCGSGRALQKWHLGGYGCSGSDMQIYYRCAELGHIAAADLAPVAPPSPPKKCPAGYEEYEWDYNVQGYTSYSYAYTIESCK